MVFLGFFNLNKKRKTSESLTDFQWPDYVVTLEEKTIEVFIQKYPFSVVDFWAPWCAPCRAIAPRMRQLSKMYKNRIAFGKINIQENQDITKYYRVTEIPYLVFFRNGKKVTTVTGVKSVGYIKDIIEDFFEKRDVIRK